MTSVRRPAMPLDAEPSGHAYAMWDAAYILGSLSHADRREFEAHIAGCTSCRDAVAELSSICALLSRLDCDQAAAIGGGDASGELSLTPDLLSSLLAEVTWRRRQSRLITWTAAGVAAVMLVIGVLCAVEAHSLSSVPAAPQARMLAPPRAQLNTTSWPQQSRVQRLASATQPLVDLRDGQVPVLVYPPYG